MRDEDDYRTGDSAKPMRRRHDEFVNFYADRLGVTGPEILAAVRNFGFTAEDIAAAKDADALTRYPVRNGTPVGLTILGMAPIRHSRIPPRREPQREFKASEAKPAKATPTARRKVKRTSSAWPHDHGATSLGQALKRVGFK